MLLIERGRYNSTAHEERICPYCRLLDDEVHLSKCNAPLRKLHFDNFYGNASELDDNGHMSEVRFITLLENPTVKFTCF